MSADPLPMNQPMGSSSLRQTEGSPKTLQGYAIPATAPLRKL